MLRLRRQAGLLEYHASMVADGLRTTRFRDAIREVVKPGDVVLDLGCGTAILSLFASEAGARHVYAIDDTEILDVARSIVKASPHAGRLTLLGGHSMELELPEPVDVVVSETLGNFALEEGLLGSVLDARTRFLRPGGSIIPGRVALIAAPLECPALYSARVDPWSENILGCDLSVARTFAVNNLAHALIEPSWLLAGSETLIALDLTEISRADVSTGATFRADRSGVLHGIGGWFDAQLSASVHLSNRPPVASSSWANLFLPLEHPVAVALGDRIALNLRWVDDGAIMCWRVETPRETFDQSTAWGFPLPRSAGRDGAT